ncbi:MAG: Translation initiation factor IF-3 [Chlamydiia bacterium]|nr:Translation initiation factor IF-3 [Chlamydiia bacterium]
MKRNGSIRATNVRVITEKGEQLGILPIEEAMRKAREEGLDLVEVSPNANPPVCKIIDYGKHKYQQTKKLKENQKQQHQTKVKEIKFRPNIDQNDLNVKINRAKDFLRKGDKVKVTCMFRGREIMHPEVGERAVNRFCEELTDVATPEGRAKMAGRSLGLVLAPAPMKKKAEIQGDSSGQTKSEA